MRHRLMLLGFIFGLVSFSISCSSSETVSEVKLALDWYPNANHIGLYFAEENGYFEDESLKVTIYTPSDPSTVLQTVASGADDFGINYQPDVLIARSEGVPVVSVLGMVQHPLNSMMSLQSSANDSPRDLKGKKVGYPGIPWNEDALNTMLQSDGLSGIGDIELVNVGWELGSSMISETVDAIIGAYFTHESIVLENEGHPVNVMRMEDWGVPDYYELVMVTSEEYLSKNPDVVERFTRAVRKGYTDAISDPQAGVDVLKKNAPEIDENVDRPGANLLQDLWKGKDGKFGTQEEVKWVSFAEWMKKRGIIDKDVNPKDAFTDKYSNN